MAYRLHITQKDKILVVDDQIGMRELLLALFRKNGYQTVAAPNAVEGFNLAAELAPTVAIIDFHIAGGGGLNLIRRMRAELPHVKCLFMTAHDDPALFEQAAKAGALDGIRKPFDLLRLLAKVERLIAARNVILLGIRHG